MTIENEKPRSLIGRVLSIGQFGIALALTLAFLAYLVLAPSNLVRIESNGSKAKIPPAVQLAGPMLIQVRSGTPFDDRIETHQTTIQRISDPVLVVNGRVAASLRPGTSNDNSLGQPKDFWQFESVEILNAFNDWQKSQADMLFSKTQLAQTKSLNEARIDAQTQRIARLERLVVAGTDSANSLASEKATLIETRLLGAKELHDAENAVLSARRSEAAAVKLLQQEGIEPALLVSATSEIDIVIADVPEGRWNQVRKGQACRCSFLGVPGENFTGSIESISPVLSKGRRALRVSFKINDPNDLLRPGMFAEVGLGTEERESLLIPADGILRIERSDYVLIETDPGFWKVTEVSIGEPRNGDVEILSGVSANQSVLSKGAILFKPLVVDAITAGRETKVARSGVNGVSQ